MHVRAIPAHGNCRAAPAASTGARPSELGYRARVSEAHAGSKAPRRCTAPPSSQHLRRRLVPALASLGLASAGCTSAEPKPAAQLPALAEVQPVPFAGSCAHAPAMGDLAAYRRWSLTLADDGLGYVRVRSCAVWPAEDLRNVLGSIAADEPVPAFGPVKHEPFPAGVGYVVPLLDPEGSRCRGYVSRTVVAHVEAYPEVDPEAGLPLPSAEVAWAGPCLPEGE